MAVAVVLILYSQSYSTLYPNKSISSAQHSLSALHTGEIAMAAMDLSCLPCAVFAVDSKTLEVR